MSEQHGRLQAANNRFLVHEDREPFFWLADTARELFHRLSRKKSAIIKDNEPVE